MKRALTTLLLIMFLLGTVSAFADVAIKKTSKKWCHRHLYKDEYYKARPAIESGVGLDLILYNFEPEAKNMKSIKLELKKDFIDMERFEAYLVAEIDVSSVFDFLK